jgi:hypothetical protein
VAIRAADQLVALSYLLGDLFGDHDRARDWLARARAGEALEGHLPGPMTDDNKALLRERFAAAGTTVDGDFDEVRLGELRTVMALVPLVQVMEESRRPAPGPSLVCTLPELVELSKERRHFARSLATLVQDALRSAEDGPVLIASPFWSRPGCELLRPALARTRERGLPLTLCGASRRDPERDDHAVMLDFGRSLAADGFRVEAYGFEPPDASGYGLFHAKAVAGRTGYLGSGNITAAGMERHVEVGVPLAEVDVAEVWWLLGELEHARLLAPEAL